MNLGEALALLTAVTWAFAVILFKKSGERTHPIGLNLFKDLLAVILLIPTIYIFGETLFHPAGWQDYVIIFISGAVGIGLADTLFFKCLNTVGAGMTAIVDYLYSPFVIGGSILFLGETLSVLQAVGTLMIISAVITAISESNIRVTDRKTMVRGVLYGVAAIAFNAIGIVIVKPVLEYSPLMWVTEMRLLSGVIVLAVVLLFLPSRRTIIRSVTGRIGMGYTFFGSFTGGYMAMILWLGGMKFTEASTAAALNQTSNIFMFIFAAIFLKEKLTPYRLVAIAIGLVGAYLVSFG